MSQQTGQQMRENSRQQQGQDASLMEKTGEQASGIAQMAREGAASRAQSQKDQVATRLTSVADAVDKVGQQLKEEDQNSLANYASMASEKVRSFSDSLQQKDVDELVHDVENTIRERPALMLGGMFALGMLGARFLKSSPPEAEHSFLDQPTHQRSHVTRPDTGMSARPDTAMPTRPDTAMATPPVTTRDQPPVNTRDQSTTRSRTNRPSELTED